MNWLSCSLAPRLMLMIFFMGGSRYAVEQGYCMPGHADLMDRKKSGGRQGSLDGLAGRKRGRRRLVMALIMRV